MAVDGEPARVKARVFIFIPRLGPRAHRFNTNTLARSQIKPQKLHKRGQRTGKQQRRKTKGKERALAVAERTSTKLSKGGRRAAKKKAAKGLY